MENHKIKRFDFYHDLKQVMKSQHRQCRDCINPSSVYCMECKESSCGTCSINNHQEHSVIPTLPYYLNENNSVIEDHFSVLNKLFEEDTGCINVPQLREALTQLIQSKVGELSKTLEKIKESKLNEVNTLLSNSESSVATLKSSVHKIKESVADFILANNSFIALSSNIQPGSTETTQYTNYDFGNSSFLMRYDILEASSHHSNEIMEVVKEINSSIEKYQNSFIKQAEDVNELLQKMLIPTEECFNYTGLTPNYYTEVEEKLITYNDLISTLKTNVFDSVAQHYSFEDIEQKTSLLETKNKQRIDTVLNNETINSPHTTINHQTITITDGCNNKKPMNRSNTSKTNRRSCKSHRGDKPDSVPELKLAFTEINLSLPLIQRYFTYQMLDLLSSIYHTKKTKFMREASRLLHEDEIEVAKPIPGTNEIQVYDRIAGTTHKKKVQFDKTKHQYNYFLNGARCVLIKDRLYITGGLDKEMKESNACYVYYIKTNELKPMAEMKNTRAYHAMEFLEFFKSIIVIGGENNSTCELYDMYTSRWKPLPNLNCPRSNSSIYLDRLTNIIYCCFGVPGSITKVDLYSDAIEQIELRKASNGWSKVDYVNKSEMDFRNSYCRIFPIDPDKILIYGASGVRELKKQSAIFLLRSHEIVKIDSKTFDEMRLCAKKFEKMNEIISKFI